MESGCADQVRQESSNCSKVVRARASVTPAWRRAASPFIAATGTTLVKKYGSRTSSLLLNRNGMLFGAGALAAAAWLTEDPASARWTAPGVTALVALALFGTTMSFGIYFWLLRTTPASRLALITYVTPIIAMSLGALTGDGTVDTHAWIGTGLVVLGIVLVVRRR